ncbi:MAG: hypothetical protein IKY27_00310 [Bacteroidales bacterium]|nr:hypothetical protein [Bacteroidales bacterium]
MKNLTCEVCGTEFPPEKDRRYIARDGQVTGGIAAALTLSEPTLYDAFNCPKCGCQVIAQERKRVADFNGSVYKNPTPPESPEKNNTEGAIIHGER